VNFWLCQRCFTDAKTDTPGRFETADNGTVFLDEIGNIPLHLQSKLLHVLQTRKVTRLGESKPRNLNVRIISATNSDIKAEIENKTFREDLLYRINTMEINLPPLRERKDDIVPMAHFLLKQLGENTRKSFLTKRGRIYGTLPLKGNIRELENKIERALIMSDDNISVTDLDLLSFEYTETAEEYPLLEMEKRYRKTLLKITETSLKPPKNWVYPEPLYRRLEKFDIKNND
jgi:DNA-binding NtrC family response regulator